ncbi:centrosomal protein of 55 kDa-like [Sardina pilchardus]|uniref:centrosomal protein of 55 kDa-like n=1 Tax=Sardina pilchardus TaxID=27697 RepID=UPI002E119E8B
MNLHIREVEERAKLLQSLKTETEDIKNRLVAVSARCHELENIQPAELQVYKPASDVETVQELLRDALEKNQQWLAYDQQREAYVTAVLARIYQLEQQQSGTSVAIQQQQHKDPDSRERSCRESQGEYEKALKSCEEQLKQELQSIALAQAELGRVKREVHDKKEELCQVQTQTQEKQEELDQLRLQIEEANRDRSEIQDLLCCKWTELDQLQKEIQVKQCELDQVQHQIRDKHCEMSQMHQQLKDHKRELSKGVQLQEVLQKQQEKQTRIAVLEKQVSRFAENVETQTCEKQHLQKHLHKVLKDLSKAQEYISKLEDELDKAQSKTVTSPGLEKHVQSLKGSPRVSSPLDESFLECPNCRLQYPTSRHRELVIHIDKCCG